MERSNVLLGPDNVKLLVSGLAFGRAIQAALGKNKLLDGLRINNKEGNWNALVPVLRRLTVRVDNDAKSLILSGDAQVAARLMNQLWATFSIDRYFNVTPCMGWHTALLASQRCCTVGLRSCHPCCV